MHTSRRGSRASGAGGALLKGRRHDLLGKVQVFPEVLDALNGQIPVEVLPVGIKRSKEPYAAEQRVD